MESQFLQKINSKILDQHSLQQQLHQWRLKNKKIVFTNGCFDILHTGHITLLSQAAEMGDMLIVGLNTDNSVKKLKGPQRPVNKEQDRAMLLAALLLVDAVTLFDEDTPGELIKAILPDVLVKGGDYSISEIVGADTVLANGGRIEIVPIVAGYSTTNIITQMKSC
jgi:D-glycero-beta-D-manno-heptose 1-phosphate adenylyltransferase